MTGFRIFFLAFFSFFNSLNLLSQQVDEFKKGQDFYNKGNFKKSVQVFSKIIESSSANADYYLARAKSFYKLKKTQEAYDDYCKAVKFGNMNSKYYYERGLFLESINNMPLDAIDDFTMARNYAKDDSMIYNCFYHRATLRAELRDFDNSLVDFRNAYSMHSDDIKLLNNFAMYYHSMGQLDSAMALLQKAIVIDSTESFLLENIAFVYSGMEKYEESLNYFDKCFNVSKELNALLLNNRGYVKYKLKDYNAALKDINASLKKNKYNSYAFRNRALVYIDIDKLDNACEDINQALKLKYTEKYGDDVIDLYNKYCK